MAWGSALVAALPHAVTWLRPRGESSPLNPPWRLIHEA